MSPPRRQQSQQIRHRHLPVTVKVGRSVGVGTPGDQEREQVRDGDHTTVCAQQSALLRRSQQFHSGPEPRPEFQFHRLRWLLSPRGGPASTDFAVRVVVLFRFR